MTPPLQAPSGPLIFQGAPADGAFLLTGRRAILDGHARMGVARLGSPSGEMIRALKAEGGDCRRFSYSPGSLLRELEAPGGLLREVVLVPRDLPGAVFQWHWEPAADGPREWHLAVSWRPGEGLSPSRSGGRGAGVLTTLSHTSRSRRVLFTTPETSRWTFHERQGALFTTVLHPDAPALLAVTEAGPEDGPPDPGFFRRLRSWQRARAGDEAQADEELLSVRAAGTDLHQGVAWARARLECPVLDHPSSDATWLGLGALCAGRFDLAREALATLARSLEDGEGLREAHGMLRAQVALWAGDRGRDAPGDPPAIPVPVGAPPRVLTLGSLAARAQPVQLARALCALAAGTLGARPDAAFGRLGLAPALPSHWRRFEARNLPMGDVRVTLGYRRVNRRHTFSFLQTRGRVPANVVFEPLVTESDLISVTVDGEPAELDVLRRRGGVGARLQFPLDPERSVALEGRGTD